MGRHRHRFDARLLGPTLCRVQWVGESQRIAMHQPAGGALLVDEKRMVEIGFEGFSFLLERNLPKVVEKCNKNVTTEVSLRIPIKELLEGLSGLPLSPVTPAERESGQPLVARGDWVSGLPLSPVTPAERESGQPLVARGDWEQLPGQSGVKSHERHVVRVSNIPRALGSQQIKQTFERHVGPVQQCAFDQQGVASLQFASEDHARQAVALYDGGILEIGDMDQVVTMKDNSCCQSYLEDHMGPLSRCSMRRGKGWMTIFQSEIGRQLKKDKMDGKTCTEKGFKACFLSVYHGYWQSAINAFMEGSPIDL